MHKWSWPAGLALMVLAGLLVVLWPQGSRPPQRQTIGTVSLTAVDRETIRGLRDEMNWLGYQEGRDIAYRIAEPAGSPERLDAVIADHLKAKVDLIFVSSTPAAQAVKRATAGSALPVVFAPVNDPLAAGIVDSISHPGGNITGVRLPLGDQPRLQWLTTLAPAARRVYIPYTESDRSALESVAQVREAATAMGLELLLAPISGEADITPALASAPAAIDAVFLPRDSTVEAHIDEYVAFSITRKIPLSAPSYQQVRAGALYCYGFIHTEVGRQAAHLVDKILHGVPPGQLPVETGESYLALNLATAEAIGIAIPDRILNQASLVIRSR